MNNMSQKKESVLNFIISALVGSFFIFSAITKILPIESFEFTLKSQLGFSDFASAYWARFFVGFEAGLGLLLLANVFGKSKWVIKLSFAMVVAFTVHLAILYARLGNDVNCGCMGDRFYMPPLQSILKNLVLLVLLVIIWKGARRNNSNTQHWVASLILAALVSVPFIMFPYQTKVLKIEKAYQATEAHRIPKEDLRKGKHFVAFLSLTCSHCMVAGEELSKLKKENPDMPIYVLFGDVQRDSLRTEMLDNFIKESNFEGLPYSFIDNKDFIELSGGSVPALFWIEDGKIIRKPGVSELNAKEIELWLNRKN